MQIGHNLHRFLQCQIVKVFLLKENISDRGRTLTGHSISLIVLILAKNQIGIIFCIHISCKILIGVQKLFQERTSDSLTLDYIHYQ